jgi:hypothetical protein
MGHFSSILSQSLIYVFLVSYSQKFGQSVTLFTLRKRIRVIRILCTFQEYSSYNQIFMSYSRNFGWSVTLFTLIYGALFKNTRPTVKVFLVSYSRNIGHSVPRLGQAAGMRWPTCFDTGSEGGSVQPTSSFARRVTPKLTRGTPDTLVSKRIDRGTVQDTNV